MAEMRPTSKRTMQDVFKEAGDRKIMLLGPNNEKAQDSRFQVHEAAEDHVIIKMLGEMEFLVIPYSALSSVKLERQMCTIRYR